jgi:hypothetical protein
VKPARESTFVLRECKRCNYSACLCLTLKHKPTCPWRVAVLDTNPQPCAHGLIACARCGAVCDCGGPMVKVRKVEEVA